MFRQSYENFWFKFYVLYSSNPTVLLEFIVGHILPCPFVNAIIRVQLCLHNLSIHQILLVEQHKKSSTNILQYVCTACLKGVRSCPTTTYYTLTHCKIGSNQLYLSLKVHGASHNLLL